ncbi:calcium-binding protein [Leptolyngbya sp. FACHB-541]|uniref:calcium-binding protein n=1 Tax=Leptolyngbya sp. FACHB-541 TaxID=2692810 RepID=UPI001689D372|nr:calcium-binding protein [Leptolyngbya sp. FACHB-541]MBD1999338.1 calcium-binding protein [Leptolyngbya sp. FACHB-541]
MAVIHGTDGNDYLQPPVEFFIVSPHPSYYNDSIFGYSGNDTLNGQEGDDYLSGDYGDDVLIGGSGTDRLYGGSGNDRLYGGNGSDTLVGGYGNDYINGFRDNRTSTTPQYDNLYGGTGTDTFVLGDYNGVFYQGNGYATIRDFSYVSDYIQVKGSLSQYHLSTGNWTGTSSSDTALYRGSDLIAVIQDTTNVSLSSRDFKVV